MSVSAVVITKNEEKTIERCLRSLSFADEIIVVDDFSDDATVAIAERLGARIISQRFMSYGQQKNIGASHAQYGWVLFVDADERISPALAHEITATLAAPKYDVYWLRVLDIFLGRALKHTPGHNPRLLRKSKARWTHAPVHEQVELIGPPSRLIRLRDQHSGVLNEFLFHDSHKTVAQYLKKMHHYTTLDAQQMFKTNKHRSGRAVRPSFLLPYSLALRQFIKLALWRGGILDGYPGWVWATLSSYYEWEMGRKYLALCA